MNKKNTFIVLLGLFITQAPECYASNPSTSVALQELARAGNNGTDAPLLNSSQQPWKTQAYNYFTSPSPFFSLGNACLAIVITTGSISAKLMHDKDSSSCSNDTAIHTLNVTTTCLAGVAFVAHCTGTYLEHRKKNRS